MPRHHAMTLTERAAICLRASVPFDKVALSGLTATWWGGADDRPIGQVLPPARPGRPGRPALISPDAVPRRRIGPAVEGRVALLHALAHIELNAIDLAWDIIARFADQDLPRAFYDDWVGVAHEESQHFALLAGRLAGLDASYGDMPAHDGLWQAAQNTADDLTARLAIVPLVLEARGLDVTLPMVARLKSAGDHDSAAILQRIHDDEIGHVAVGKRWFDWVCTHGGLDPRSQWQTLVKARFHGSLKPPFNEKSRDRAGFAADWYGPLAADRKQTCT